MARPQAKIWPPRFPSRWPQEKWSRRDSNPRHLACKASALPTELRPQNSYLWLAANGFPQMGAPRFELGTSALSGLRSNQLSYAPARQQAGHFKWSEPSAEGV